MIKQTPSNPDERGEEERKHSSRSKCSPTILPVGLLMIFDATPIKTIYFSSTTISSSVNETRQRESSSKSQVLFQLKNHRQRTVAHDVRVINADSSRLGEELQRKSNEPRCRHRQAKREWTSVRLVQRIRWYRDEQRAIVFVSKKEENRTIVSFSFALKTIASGICSNPCQNFRSCCNSTATSVESIVCLVFELYSTGSPFWLVTRRDVFNLKKILRNEQIRPDSTSWLIDSSERIRLEKPFF